MGLLCGSAGGRKAVKALHLSLGQEAWGHVVARLLEELPGPKGPGLRDVAHLVEKAKVLDNFYVATRYANGHPEGAPFRALRHVAE